MRKGPPAMNNREIAEHIIGLSLDMSMHDVESIERIEKALDIKDDHATEVQTKLLTQITTLREALEREIERSDNFKNILEDAADDLCFRNTNMIGQHSGPEKLRMAEAVRGFIGHSIECVERKLPRVEALAVLATSKDTEGDQGNILAGNEAAPSGPYNHASGCRAKPDEMPPCDCSYGPDDEYVRNQPDYYDRDKRQPTQKEEMPGISWAEYKPQPSDNDRVMDLIRAAEKYFCQTEKDCHCLDMNYEVCDVCKEQLLAISVATNALPPHIIERARNRKGE